MKSKPPDGAAVLKNAALPKQAAEPQEKFFTKTDLKEREWTDLAIKRFAGEPDELRPNPYYRKGPDMQLFRAERIETIEASPEFLEFRENAKPRQDDAARAVATKSKRRRTRKARKSGAQRRGTEMRPEERRRVAFQEAEQRRRNAIHEAGHLAMAYWLGKLLYVRRIVLHRDRFGGSFECPVYGVSESALMVLIGGPMAERLLYGKVPKNVIRFPSEYRDPNSDSTRIRNLVKSRAVVRMTASTSSRYRSAAERSYKSPACGRASKLSPSG